MSRVAAGSVLTLEFLAGGTFLCSRELLLCSEPCALFLSWLRSIRLSPVHGAGGAAPDFDSRREPRRRERKDRESLAELFVVDRRAVVFKGWHGGLSLQGFASYPG